MGEILITKYSQLLYYVWGQKNIFIESHVNVVVYKIFWKSINAKWNKLQAACTE